MADVQGALPDRNFAERAAGLAMDSPAASAAGLAVAPELLRAAGQYAAKTGVSIRDAVKYLAGKVPGALRALDKASPAVAKYGGRVPYISGALAGGAAVAQPVEDIMGNYSFEGVPEGSAEFDPLTGGGGQFIPGAQYAMGLGAETLKGMDIFGGGGGGAVVPSAQAAQPSGAAQPSAGGPPEWLVPPEGKMLPNSVNATVDQGSPEAMKADPQAPAKLVKTLKSNDIDIDKITADAMAKMGGDPRAAAGLTEQEKGEMLLDFGLRMMAASNTRGSTTAGNMGEAGMGTLQNVRALRQQKKGEAAAEYERRQKAADRAVDYEFKKRGLQRQDRQLSIMEQNARARAAATRGTAIKPSRYVTAPGGAQVAVYGNRGDFVRMPDGAVLRAQSITTKDITKARKDIWNSRASRDFSFTSLPREQQDAIVDAELERSFQNPTPQVGFGVDPDTGQVMPVESDIDTGDDFLISP